MKNFKLITLILIVSVMVFTGCKAASKPAVTAAPDVTAAPMATADTNSSAAPESYADPKATGNAADGTLILTLDELSAYNGENGNPAYIAVDGVIYDVTNVPQWRKGKHNGFTAGKDLTNEIKTISPHGTSKLKGVPVVGKIAP